MSFFVLAVSERRLEAACGAHASSWKTDLCRNAYDATGTPLVGQALRYVVDKGLSLALIFVFAWIANRVLRRAVVRIGRGVASGRLRGTLRRATPRSLMDTHEHVATGAPATRSEQRREAVLTTLKSIVTGIVYAIALVTALGELGVNLAALVAGVSVFGVAVGLGAQSLIKDFLSGMFILLEDQYGVGDTIVLNTQTGTTGTVENVTLRTTRLRSAQGTVWHVPNSQITMVGNESQLWSRAVIDVEIAHDAEIAAAKHVLAKVGHSLREDDQGVLEDPDVQGVQALSATGVSLRLTVKTVPSQQWRISRELRERIKVAFDDAGISMAPAPA
ncbi:MAG: mechanosensitive ion channel family protein [Solirubrobacteraceae bacterium]